MSLDKIEAADAHKHLWEAKHSYYCNDGNYYSNDCYQTFPTMAAFVSAEGDADLDYNYLIRWDWDESSEDGEGNNYNGDDYYRNGVFKLYFVSQRKGIFRVAHVAVCRADEPEALKYLRPRLAYIQALWSPLSDAELAGEQS